MLAVVVFTLFEGNVLWCKIYTFFTVIVWPTLNSPGYSQASCRGLPQLASSIRGNLSSKDFYFSFSGQKIWNRKS